MVVGLCVHTERSDPPSEQPAGADLPAGLVQTHSVSPGITDFLLEAL